jgi:hypothetical protein
MKSNKTLEDTTVLENFWQCTCGQDFTSEKESVDHVTELHASDKELADVDRLRERVVILISNPRPFSWQAKWYA